MSEYKLHRNLLCIITVHLLWVQVLLLLRIICLSMCVDQIFFMRIDVHICLIQLLKIMLISVPSHFWYCCCNLWTWVGWFGHFFLISNEKCGNFLALEIGFLIHFWWICQNSFACLSFGFSLYGNAYAIFRWTFCRSVG